MMRLVWLSVLCLFFFSGSLLADTQLGVEQINAKVELPNISENYPDFKLKDLIEDESGFLSNRASSDAFFSVSGLDLPRSEACNLVLDLEFKQPMFRPALFEVFWAADPGAFSEAQKARFLISHNDTRQPHTFVVPLCKLYTFSGNLSKPHHQRNIVGFRLDYPMNRDIALKINRADLVNSSSLEKLKSTVAVDYIQLEPFERLSGAAFSSFDVMVPKVFFGIEDGFKRLSQDLPFMIFWLLLILICIGLIIRSLPARD